jgi:hypothetical protein
MSSDTSGEGDAETQAYHKGLKLLGWPMTMPIVSKGSENRE